MVDGYRAAYNDFRTQFFTVEELQKEMYIEHLSIFTPLNGSNVSWNIEEMSRFIESLIVGQPQSALFFDGSQPLWYVLAGRKRLDALFRFCRNEYSLQNLYFYGDQFENKMFRELPLLIQRKILNYRFSVHILNPGATDSVRYGIYMSILEGPKSLLKDSIRQFIYPINFKKLSLACDGVRPYFWGSSCYSLEDVAIRLLVYLLYRGYLFPSNYSLTQSNMDLLANYLLKQNMDMSVFLNQSELGQCLFRILPLLRGPYPNDIQKMDVALALLASGTRMSVDFIQLDRCWETMIQYPQYQGDVFGRHLDRIEYLENNLPQV